MGCCFSGYGGVGGSVLGGGSGVSVGLGVFLAGFDVKVVADVWVGLVVVVGVMVVREGWVIKMVDGEDGDEQEEQEEMKKMEMEMEKMK